MENASMKITIVPRWTIKEGIGLGVSVTWPYRCAEVQESVPGTIRCGGIGFGLIVARVYVQLAYGFTPFHKD